MKILFLGDYSNVHTTLGRELRRRGHEVTVVSDKCGCMGLDTDIYVSRGSYIGSGFTYLYRLFSLMPDLKGYDVVQFINPHFFELRPGKLRYFLRELRRHNGNLFLTLAGNDHFFLKRCLDRSTFRYSEFRVGYERTEYSRQCPQFERGYMLPGVADYTEWFYRAMDGGMAVLPEYYIASRDEMGDKLIHTGLPIDLDDLRSSPLPEGDKVRILVGMRSASVSSKGTDRLLELAQELAREHESAIEVRNVCDLPWREYLEEIRHSHIVLDQLYSYSPGMNALNTLALGRVCGSGAQPEYYSTIGEPDLRPLLSLSPLEDNLKENLLRIATDRDKLSEMAASGRKLVEKHNDVRLIADRYESHWNHLMKR